ncbi:MAG TPA: pilus assembly protein PilP [Methylophilaceae bacterium]|nr:pilus assembly protein PilP [Methylophilaceae bacterium]
MNTKSYIWIWLPLALIACSSNQGDDLDKFMQDAGKDMRAKIDPLPEVKPYVPLEYNADGELHDPFKPRKAQSSKTSGIQPDFNRPKEPLEAYPLESLKYVGSLSKQNLKYALIKTPDNSVQQVTIGNYMGQNFGIVTEINESEVVLKEIVQDGASGDWTEQTSSIALQE